MHTIDVMKMKLLILPKKFINIKWKALRQKRKFKCKKQLKIIEYFKTFSLPILSGIGEKNNKPKNVPIKTEKYIEFKYHSFSQKNPKL